jgi:hypothetical protein
MRTTLLSAALLLAGLPATVGPTASTFTIELIDVPDEPQRVAVGDVDGDADIDLVLLSSASTLQASALVLANDGAGQFSLAWSDTLPQSPVTKPYDLDLADSDADGDLDLLFVVPSGKPAQRFNDGSGQFHAPGSIPKTGFRVSQEPADLDGDGLLDLAYFEDDFFGYFGTLQGVGGGTFQFDFSTEISLFDNDSGRHIALGDASGDGVQDAATNSYKGLQYMRGVSKGVGNAQAWAGPFSLYADPCLDVVMVDLNGDGLQDIVASVPSIRSLIVLVSRGKHAFLPPKHFIVGWRPNALAAGDLDLDGAADVIVTGLYDHSLYVIAGTGNGALEAPVTFALPRRPTDVEAADLDGDGDLDIAVTCALDRQVALLVNATL